MNEKLLGFECHELDEHCKLWVGQLPPSMLLDILRFETLWGMHPAEFHEVKIHGRPVKTPRWQQAYGVNYSYTGSINNAQPIPATLLPYASWARENVCGDLNALLLNWYDGRLGHYIGRHRDSIKQMYPGAPIVTISFGEERTFRIRRWSVKGSAHQPQDFVARDGTVFVMSWETNRAFTHEILRSKRQTGRRISATLRALESPACNE